MNCFNDKNGRQWTLELNVGSARRVKAETGFDILNIMDLGDGEGNFSGFEKLASDAGLLVDVIYSLCKSQAEKSGLDGDGFAELFNGDAVEGAADALVKEIIDFSQPLKRKMLTVIYERTKRFREEAMEQMTAELESGKVGEILDAELSRLSTNTQGQ